MGAALATTSTSTPVPASAFTPNLVDRVQQLLERVDYRRAETSEDREAIFRLRYDAYLREGAVAPSLARRVADNFDEGDRSWIFGVYIDGRLASSFRINLATKDFPELPATRVFGDVLLPELDAGKVIIDPTRFVTDRESSRTYPELPYVTSRIGWLAAGYFGADYLLGCVRTEHQGFYRRVYRHRLVCPARPYPSLTKPISLMICDYPVVRDQVQQRYPFFRSVYFERRMLFERFTDASRRSAA